MHTTSSTSKPAGADERGLTIHEQPEQPEQPMVPPEPSGFGRAGPSGAARGTDGAVAAADPTPDSAPPDGHDDVADPDADGPDAEATEHWQRKHRRRRRYYVIGAVAGVVIAAIVTLNVVHVGFYMLAPGSVRRTEELVVVDGQRTFPDDAGSISYTTVSFSQASLWNKLTARFDQSVDLVDEDSILRGQDPDQNRKENLEMMDVSKQEATVVALRKLGYKVETKGTGAVVQGLTDGGPAKDHLSVGDAIVAIDGTPVATQEDLVRALSDRKPGEDVTLTIEPDRSGRQEQKALLLAARPDQPEKGFLGVQLVTRDLNFSYPFQVSIDSGQVGGPSAGLAFTLGVIDVLTPGSLTGGTKIATTGTIDLNGRVGPVGGVKQKTFAVRASGATLFLVPPEEYEEAKRYAGDELRVIKVETLDQALDAIAQNGGNTGPVAEAAAGRS